MMNIGPNKKQKIQKPINENSMKGLIDLYKNLNEIMYTRVQDSIPNSDCLGLTKEQRTRLASIESRSDANKELFQRIQMELLEREKNNVEGGLNDGGANLSDSAQAVFQEAQKIIDIEESKK